jgi:hypothetical protein
MKKLLITLVAVSLIGAGCLKKADDSYNWALDFSLPSGWVAVAPYSELGEPIKLDQPITEELSEIFLQTGEKHIVTLEDDKIPTDMSQYGAYEKDSYVRISVIRLSERRIIPTSAEDLGKGFYKEGDKYYFQGKEGKYQFTVKAEGMDLNEAEKVILSAKE